MNNCSDSEIKNLPALVEAESLITNFHVIAFLEDNRITQHHLNDASYKTRGAK